MSIINPFVDDSAPAGHEDQALVVRVRSGNREGLEELVQRHQSWIYNIAVRMLYHPQDAQDATQEILIKMLTRLSSFEGRSSFRTWLQRPGPAGQNREPWHRPERYNAHQSFTGGAYGTHRADQTTRPANSAIFQDRGADVRSGADSRATDGPAAPAHAGNWGSLWRHRVVRED